MGQSGDFQSGDFQSADFLRLAGRDSEMNFLTTAFGDARQGKTVAVFVGGESGVGKTRLVTEFTSTMAGDNVIVLSGAAIDLADAPPFWPVTDAMRRLLAGPRIGRESSSPAG